MLERGMWEVLGVKKSHVQEVWGDSLVCRRYCLVSFPGSMLDENLHQTLNLSKSFMDLSNACNDIAIKRVLLHNPSAVGKSHNAHPNVQRRAGRRDTKTSKTRESRLH